MSLCGGGVSPGRGRLFLFTLSKHDWIERRALNDRENLVRERIKLSTVRSVRRIFAEAYRQAN